MKIWVTKYALTEGIRTHDNAKLCEGYTTRMVECGAGGGGGIVGYYHGDDWHTTEEAALARAEAMRLKAVAALEKKLAKLKKMKFV